MSGVSAPCGQQFAGYRETVDHAAVCPQCRTAVLMQQEAVRPLEDTVSLRRGWADAARDSLRNYVDNVGVVKDPMQLTRLAWALSHLETALYYETCGRYGTENSHARIALERQKNSNTPE